MRVRTHTHTPTPNFHFLYKFSKQTAICIKIKFERALKIGFIAFNCAPEAKRTIYFLNHDHNQTNSRYFRFDFLCTRFFLFKLSTRMKFSRKKSNLLTTFTG